MRLLAPSDWVKYQKRFLEQDHRVCVTAGGSASTLAAAILQGSGDGETASRSFFSMQEKL